MATSSLDVEARSDALMKYVSRKYQPQTLEKDVPVVYASPEPRVSLTRLEHYSGTGISKAKVVSTVCQKSPLQAPAPLVFVCLLL